MPTPTYCTRYFVLAELASETIERPGALFREVRDARGYRMELLTGRDTWTERPDLLATYCLRGEPAADVIPEPDAVKLAASHPWPGARTFPNGGQPWPRPALAS